MNQTKSDILIVKLVAYKVDKSGNKVDFFWIFGILFFKILIFLMFINSMTSRWQEKEVLIAFFLVPWSFTSAVQLKVAGKQTLAMWVCRWFKEEGNIDRNDKVAYKVGSAIK